VTTTALDRLRAADPLVGGARAPEEWREALLARIASEPGPAPDLRRRRQARLRLVLVAAAVLALLAIPSYGVARDVIAWVRGEPAPQAVVDDFASHAPQLGYRPDAGGAILVAVDDEVRLYSTKNDRGSYCLVLTAPGRPRGDGGTCIRPQWAGEPLIAGTIGVIAGDGGSTTFVVGRSTATAANEIRFAGTEGEPITRPIGFDGFFVAEVSIPRAACGAGDWRPTFVVLDAGGAEVARADITLLFGHGPEGVCGFSPPHPPHVR
jgi:hypothetical protein